MYGEMPNEKNTHEKVTVLISPDKMKAYIVLFPQEGDNVITAEQIYEKLRESGVVFGIDDKVIESIVEAPVYNQQICVAQGTEPVNGTNGTIQFHFRTEKDLRPVVQEDGKVDFRSLNLIENVKKGDKLCTIIPPTQGISGNTVTGETVSAINGKPAVIPKGKNVSIGDDGLSLISNIDGQVEYVNDKVNVFPNYEVADDVDNSTGNINFVGNVIVRGNVLSGFKIEAGGFVEVWGVVEGAVIKANGSIILRKGMHGQDKGILISNNDIIAKYIEHSTIEAKNNVTAEAIMHCNLKCGNTLELVGRKGLIVGGKYRVGKRISAKTIGSYMSVGTEIEVGADPSLRERYREILKEIEKMEVDKKRAEQAIAILKKFQAAGAMTEERNEMMVRSVRTKVFYRSKIDELKKELLEIEAILLEDGKGKITVSDIIYQGTKVTIGPCAMNVIDNLRFCTLYRDGMDIRVGPYEG